ncbi:AraC family transcriptional regulator [Chitinophaga alhagiae]|uniref:AraC family transcriptional regulator n=1 Tax=Chitinophaga alhagiae TaxID=2203219 RepID=A0ABM6WAM4_9BACT|nr:helix-turn-helix domain-containing protein [Chitinophaga alhagiae]AWO00985.1 AraC family transcriptional regulator [Chitinophaga alhagiae]
MQIPDFRQRFQPVQPTVKDAGEQVVYAELLPDMRLAPYIYCYWQLQTVQPLTRPFCYRVVADGCMDIFFDLHQPEENYVMGFSTAYTEFPLPPVFHYTGIRFLPAAFPLLFHINAAELTNRFEHLAHVAPRLSKDLAALAALPSFAQAIQPALDRFFLQVLNSAPLQADSRLFNAIDIILDAKGTLPVESALNTGISPRQLRRLFSFYIGDTPKTFSKVVRFQHILHAKPSVESLKKNKLFYDGYYDQAHFIKEFKAMYGLTPTIALR